MKPVLILQPAGIYVSQKISVNVNVQAFVGVVRSDMAVLEECVNKAEDEMGSLSGLKKMLSSFVGQVSYGEIESYIKRIEGLKSSNFCLLLIVHVIRVLFVCLLGFCIILKNFSLIYVNVNGCKV